MRDLGRCTIAVACGVVLVLSGCGGDSANDDAAASVPSSTRATTSSTGVTTYSTKAFSVPFTVAVDDALTSPPARDSANLVSWAAATPGSDSAVRFLVPVEVYRPRSTAPEAPPENFVAFLRGLTADSAVITDVSDITVGGRPAALMSVTRFEDESHPSGFLDGSLGCPERGADQFNGCFGPQSDLVLRLAVVDVGDTTLLAWARVARAAPDDAFIAMFEQMLATVQFH